MLFCTRIVSSMSEVTASEASQAILSVLSILNFQVIFFQIYYVAKLFFKCTHTC